MTKPIPRRNFHRGAGRKPAGLSGVGPARVEPQEAATLQQDLKPRTQPKELLKTSRMDAATAPQPIGLPTRVREVSAAGRSRCIACTLRATDAGRAAPGTSHACSRTPRQSRCRR